MKLTPKDLHAEVGAYLSEIEEFIDGLVVMFFRRMTDGSILADEIIRRLRTARELTDFFKRVAKRTIRPEDYEEFTKHMDVFSELYRKRNQFAHGVIYTSTKVGTAKRFIYPPNIEKYAEGSKAMDLIEAELCKDPDCPFAIVPPHRAMIINDLDTINKRFYCHSIWEVTRNKVRLDVLRQVMYKRWDGGRTTLALPEAERILEATGKPAFIEYIKKNRESFYGPDAYTK
ncbi:MAG: hypothetical protein AAF936_10435 [Pseudomonadota bacterium]